MNIDVRHNHGTLSRLLLGAATVLTMLLTPLATQAQSNEFLRFVLPTDVCANSYTTIQFGYNNNFNVVFDLPMAAQSHAELAFLPDGVSCPPYGCSYRSTLTFSGFIPGATVASAQDIKYVRVNIEHSYIGDLYIGVVCPNGQRASLMNWSGRGSSDCDDEVPAGHRSWNTSYSNVSGGTYLGVAYDHSDPYEICDRTRSANQPGVGWNYCWSSNTTSGYQYAPGDGRIYRAANRTGYSIDSSDVAARQQFYHPDQNLSALVGCPLNGTWYVEVIDAFSQDNGYVFDWELSLNPELLPTSCALERREVISPCVQRVNDSTYRFHAPNNIVADTAIPVLFRIISTCGDTIDSTAVITVHPKYNITEYDTACDSYTLHGQTYTSDRQITKHFTSVDGCDSTMRYKLHINRSKTATIADTVTENQLPYIFAGQTLITPPQPGAPHPAVGALMIDSTVVATTTQGCDSTVHLTIFVWYNVADTLDSTLCRHQLPLMWNGVTFDDAGMQNVTFTNIHGADSIVTMRLTVLEDTRATLADSVVENSLPWGLAGYETFMADTAVEYLVTNSVGCDSTIHYSLHVWLNTLDSIDSTVCRHQLPLTWGTLTFSDAGVQTLALTDIHGADSITVMTLAVKEDSRATRNDTIVENSLPWVLPGVDTLLSDFDTTYTLVNAVGCDSVLQYSLHVWRNTSALADSVVCRHQLPIVWNGVTFNNRGTNEVVLVNSHGADSLLVMNLTVIEDTRSDIADTVVENDLPWVRQGLGAFDTLTDTLFLIANNQGCDSTVNYKLHVWYNVEVSYDTIVCDNVWPLVWYGHRFDGGGNAVRHLLTTHGADSTLHLHVAVNPAYDYTTPIDTSTCDNMPFTYHGDNLTTSGTYRYNLQSIYGCDSSVIIKLTVWPSERYTEYDTLCLTQMPYLWQGRRLDYNDKTTITDSVKYTTIHRCDSTITLSLNVRGVHLQAHPHISPMVVTPDAPEVVFSDNSQDAVSRIWYIGDYQSSLQQFSYNYPTDYDSIIVQLIAINSEGCHDTADVLLQLDRSHITIPNAFTPSRDDNNLWYVVTQDVIELQVWIYNRQGNLVATYDQPDGHWDGCNLVGQPCPQGSYVYKAHYRTRVHPERLQKKTGTILLIR
jgi:gliding motility-associated-like protein